MTSLLKRLEATPELVRVAPFGIFVLLTAAQGKLGPASVFWIYIFKTFLGAVVLWQVRPFVQEMRWKFSWEALVVGIAIFALWVGTDGLYPRLGKIGEGANPFQQYGAGSFIAWFYVLVHWTGMTLVVPPTEEVFYRSLLYRALVRADFTSLPLGRFYPVSFVVTSVVFGLVHPQWWLAAFVCGLAYQGLVVRKNRLGDAMTAHAITNFLLGLWIIIRHDWKFW